jgi:hypothetical protein
MKESLEDKPCFIDIANFEVAVLERIYEKKVHKYVVGLDCGADTILLRSDEWRL